MTTQKRAKPYAYSYYLRVKDNLTGDELQLPVESHVRKDMEVIREQLITELLLDRTNYTFVITDKSPEQHKDLFDFFDRESKDMLFPTTHICVDPTEFMDYNHNPWWKRILNRWYKN